MGSWLLVSGALQPETPGLLERLSDPGRWLLGAGELAAWALVGPAIVLALAGFGLRFVRGDHAELRLPFAVTSGTLAVAAVVAIANIFGPIPIWSGLVLLPLGLISFLMGREAHGIGWMSTFNLLSVVASTTALLMFPKRPRLQYDVFLYHGPFVEWMGREALPQGLGLLHTRFAFNPGLLYLTAGLRTPFGDWSHHAFVEAAVIGASAATVVATFRVARQRRDLRLSGFIAALIGAGGINLAAQTFRVGTDLAVSATLLAAVALGALVTNSRESDDCARWYGLLLMVVAFAVVQKASAVPAVLLLAAPWGMRRTGTGRRRPLVLPLAPLMLSAVLGIAWLYRTYVASACLVYPVPATCRGDVDWGIGPAGAAIESGGIRSWARQRSLSVPEVADLSWFSAWLEQYASSISFRLVVVALLGRVVVQLLLQRGDTDGGAAARLGIVRLYTGLGLVFWFVTAPDIRFATHLHVTLAALIAAPLGEHIVAWWDRPTSSRGIRGSDGQRASVGIVASALALTVFAGHLLLYGRMLPFSSEPSFAVPYEVAEHSLRLVGDPTSDRWTYFAPAWNDQCGNAFPCAPYPVDLTVDASGRRLVFLRQDP
jgi:hypothetical protein